MALEVSAKEAAGMAIWSIRRGYDLARDLRLKYCNGDEKDLPLIDFDGVGCYDVALPSGISIPNVSKLIKCSQGRSMRNRSDVISFDQMSEQFNNEMSLRGKIPSGLFNTMFDFSGCLQKDSVNTKTLAFDGMFIALYIISLEKSQVILHDHVKNAVPVSWEPAAIARFIKTFGTHVIVEVKMGGKDVLYVKQQHSSIIQPADVHTKLKKMADEMFSENSGQKCDDPKYYEKVNWNKYSHVCTAPVESYNDHSIVTGAQLQVEKRGSKKILFIRLKFSTVLGAKSVKPPEWDGLASKLMNPPPKKPDPWFALILSNISPYVYPGGPPVPSQAPKLLKFVDTTELTRGPVEIPGYWAVSGARLVVENGKISLQVKYSLLSAISPDEEGIIHEL